MREKSELFVVTYGPYTVTEFNSEGFPFGYPHSGVIARKSALKMTRERAEEVAAMLRGQGAGRVYVILQKT